MTIEGHRLPVEGAQQGAASETGEPVRAKRRFPLYLTIWIGVLVGIAFGIGLVSQ